LSRNARAVFELGKELYERLGTMGQHVDELGKSLSGAIKSYNRTVGSLESRVLVSARKLNELGVVEGSLEGPRPVEETARALSAAELLEDPEPGVQEPVGFVQRAIPDQKHTEGVW
jgi:DNA anti-recombination protein RmuC